MPTTIDRRQFIGRAAVVLTGLAGWRRSPRSVRWQTKPLRIAVIPSRAAPARALGLALGVDEARHAAELFGGVVAMVTAAAGEPFDTAAARLLAQSPTLLVGGDTAAECAALARLAAAHPSRALYFNLGCDDDTLRGPDCSRAAYHVWPSATMLRQAVAQSGGGAGARAVAWDPSLVKFGADTLNERFAKQFHTRMSADAWAGWVAVKIAWEASLRARSTSGAAIAAFLDTPAAQFDGHKGRALSFRSWNHQLRQPVYVMRGPASPPVEVPSSRAEEDARTSLDRIGIPASDSTCRF